MSEPVHTSETPATGVTVTAPATVTIPTDPPPADPPAEPKPTETVDYWKQMSRKNEERAAANAKAAERLKEIEDRDLSDLERERRDREELAAENTRLKSESARNRVALAKGLPLEIAETLNGANEVELAAHADRLIAWRGNVPPTTPRPDPGQGPRPSTPEAEQQAEYLKFFPDEAAKQR
jgi:hypothetical protein